MFRSPLKLKVTARRITFCKFRTVLIQRQFSMTGKLSNIKKVGQSATLPKIVDLRTSNNFHEGYVQSTGSNEHTHSDDPNEHAHSHEPNERLKEAEWNEAGDRLEASHSHSDSHTHSHADGSHSIFHTHSHGHNSLLTSSLSNPAVKITWIGLLVNIAMAISKGAGGIYFHSQSLVADAIHSVSDMVADFLTLATVNVSSRVGSSQNFPLGYGKIETVGSILVSGVLLFAGISVGWSSLLQVFEFWVPSVYEYALTIQFGHNHSHSHGDHDSHGHGHSTVPNINAAWIAGGSIVVKELLFRKTMKVAIQTNSKVLVANAWHHRVDSLTSLVALITVTGGYILDVAWLDLIGGLCVSILIIKAGWGTFRSSWNELVDRGEKSGGELYNKVHGVVSSEVEILDTKFQLKDLSVLLSGANINVYFTLVSEVDLGLGELNSIEERLKGVIREQDEFVKNVYLKFEKAQSTDV